MQTKSLEAMNRKTTATLMHELLKAKYLLPTDKLKQRKGTPTSKRGSRGSTRGKRRGQSGRSVGPRPQVSRSDGVIERGIPGFRALKYRCRLNYYDNIDITSGAGTCGTYIYSANGLYDPDITSTGHQPMPFDQMMLSFEHYCVVSAKLTITAKNLNPTYLADVAISLNAGTAASTAYGPLVENGMLVRQRLNVSTLQGSQATLKMPISISRFGSVPTLLDNPDYAGSVAANPAEQSYFHISVWNSYNVTTVNVICEVFIEYEAWFFEPRKNSASLERQLRNLILAEERNKATERKNSPARLGRA